MWGFPFNMFPGTNMHDLDLDWIIKVVRDMQTSLNAFINNFSNPMLAYSYSDMTNTDLIYLYVGDEIGYNKNHWYYYDPSITAWVDGGLYGSAVVDNELDPDSSNAVRNSTLSKLIDWVTPQYYGAAATGLVDDTQAIEDALASGKAVYFPEGTYLVSGQIMVPSGSVLIGDKATIRWVTNADTTFLFGGFGLQNIEVDGLTFDFGGQTSLKYGMSFTETENVKIRNCEFLNSYGYALRLSGSSKFEVDSCVFHAITGGTGNPGGAVLQRMHMTVWSPTVLHSISMIISHTLPDRHRLITSWSRITILITPDSPEVRPELPSSSMPMHTAAAY